MFQKKKILKLIGLLSLVSVFLVGCSMAGESKKAESKGDISLAYVEWDSEVASTYVVGEVLKEMGYTVSLTPLDSAIMWESIATGEMDGMVSAWLPNTHKNQLEKYQDKTVNLGTNLTGARTGLVVPSYMDVESIADLTDQNKKKIVGIEAGAGVVATAEEAMEVYPNLKDWTIDTTSSGVMTVALKQAIRNKEEIVVTGWSPHWKFAEYDLKYLEDPKGVFGEEETINTFVRKGLDVDQPEVYKLLKKFNWTTDDMEVVMLEINQGVDPEKAAQDWVKANPEKVKEWQE